MLNQSINLTVLVLLGLATLFSTGLAVFVTKHRGSERTLLAFSIVCWALGIWSGTYFLRIVLSDVAIQRALTVITHLGIVGAPTAWFVFVLLYTGNDRWVTRRSLALLSIHPVTVFALVATNGWHHLLYASVKPGTPTLVKELGPLFWPHVAYAYLILLAGIALLGFFAATSNELYRLQTTFVLLGLAIPLGVNTLFFMGIDPLPNVDPTPVALSFGMVLIGGAVFYGRLVEFVPMAHATIVSSLDEGVVVVTDDERIADVNPAAEEMLGLAADSVVGEPAETVLPTPIAALIGPTEQSIEWEHETTNGVAFYRVKQHPTSAHGIRGNVLTIADITAAKRRQRQLERQNERLDEFASVVSHDLKGPLTVARGYTSQLEKRFDEPPREVAKIEESVVRMAEITEDVLELARSGQDIGEREPVDVETVARGAWAGIEAPGASLTVEADGPILADRMRLKQIFENLFRNVGDHTDANQVAVRFEDGTLLVDDNGDGIPPDEREQIFEQGYSTESAGTGLGLAIVSNIVEGHGWRIEVEESPSGGARFVIETEAAPVSEV